MSQLLCEQVVGRGLRRTSYDVDESGRFTEEVAKVFGVPFELIPFKANKQGAPVPQPKRNRVHAIPEKERFEIRFPRVEGYTQAIRNRIAVDWQKTPTLVIDPMRIPPEVEMKAALPNNKGRPSITGPGRLENITLNPYRQNRREQELVFDLASALTKEYSRQPNCAAPAHVLFPQIARVVRQFVDEKVRAVSPAAKVDMFLSPYYGWAIERLSEAIQPDASSGEVPEVPRYETSRGPGSTSDVDFSTSRDVREVAKSHLNFVVADTKRWEQSAAFCIDRHPAVAAFVKNSGLGFAVPYLHNGQMHDYLPDFIIRLNNASDTFLILETKGYDPLEEIKSSAAERWTAAVNADRTHGRWIYRVAKKIGEIDSILARLAGTAENQGNARGHEK
jgi:type III restriction enzyme